MTGQQMPKGPAAANDNSVQGARHPALAAYDVLKAVEAGEKPERLYWKVVEFMAALARAGLSWEDSAPLRRLDNFLCRHECGVQPLAAERVAVLLGEWLAESCMETAPAVRA